jgi:quercetin dioxygenase-like cupin family protein
MGMKTRLVAVLAILAVAVAGLAGFAAGDSATSTPEPKRDAMAQTAKVQGAPGRELVLSRVVVPAGAKLALHHHLGTQVARVESGVLTYTVEQGSAVVRSGQSDASPNVVRTIKAGQTAKIKVGQWIVEQPSDVHRAANNGSKPVTIYIATLLEAGAPPATPVS